MAFFPLMLTFPLFLLALGPVCVTALEAPYNLPKFRPVLDDSKLQAPGSNTAIRQGEFKGVAKDFFYLSNGKYMTFKMSGDSRRSELRQIPEWKTSTKTSRKIIGSIKLFKPSTISLNQFTFLQIHDSSTSPPNVFINKPLLRLTWRRNRAGRSDFLWAVVRISTNPSDKPKFIPLIKRPSGFFNAEINVRDNIMKVIINGNTTVDQNVKYWEKLNSYYKAGVYLQDDGTAMTQFDTLEYVYS